MDTHPIERPDFERLLADLDRVNRVTRGLAPTLAFLARVTADWPRGSVLRVADLGYGSGRVLRAVHDWAERRGFVPELTGVDLNPHCRAIARALTPAAMAIRWHEGDLFDWRPDHRPHVILSALFAHHLPDADVVRLLRWQEATATHGWLVNDLHRHPVAWGGFIAMARLAGWHAVVRHDGALSVRRAFTFADWRTLLAQAGIDGARLRWSVPFRLCVERVRT